MRILLSLIFTLCIATRGYSQSIVSSQLAIGHVNHLDTYLSNEKYRGTQLEFISSVLRPSAKHPITYSLTHEGAIADTHNRADNASEIAGHYDFAYGIMRHWCIMGDESSTSNSLSLTSTKERSLHLYAGGFGETFLGFCYNTRTNANNPAQGYAALNIGPQVMAKYHFPLFKRYLTLTYEARIPLLGIMFSPNYGQSYYELFCEGNYDHNVLFSSIVTFQLRHQLSLDIPIRQNTALRIGYMGDIRQSTPNNLKQHQWYNAAVIGITITK